MRRRSRKRQAALDDRPAVRDVSEDRRATVGSSDVSFQTFVSRLPCVVCLGHTLGGDPCHRLARRRWGDWLEVDGELVGNLFPACRAHHREQHDRGIETFARAHGLDLAVICTVVGRAYLDGWSVDGLGTAARAGYEAVDLTDVRDGGLPF